MTTTTRSRFAAPDDLPPTITVNGCVFRRVTDRAIEEHYYMGKPGSDSAMYNAVYIATKALKELDGEEAQAILRRQTDGNGPPPYGVERWTLSCMGFDVCNYPSAETAAAAVVNLAYRRFVAVQSLLGEKQP